MIDERGNQKRMIIMKRILTWAIIALFLLPFVFAGVTAPLPSNIELTKGESGRFKFQIQAVNNDADIMCGYRLTSAPPFFVDFDVPEASIKAGTRQDIYGTVSVPETLALGTYTAEFCVSCRPSVAPAGASVNIDTCGLVLKTTVVEKRTRDNLYVPEKPQPKRLPLTQILVIAGLMIIALIAFWLFYLGKKRKRPEPHMLIPVRRHGTHSEGSVKKTEKSVKKVKGPVKGPSKASAKKTGKASKK